ncbi:MAG: FHA domain-containing protein [Bdellovibrionales bacterium]|nr:FHA domain-containing protein [Bdellovibrionales bacterium]
MFAVEIDFQDGVSPPEILLVRRPHAIIGSSESAHVLIEGAASTLYELRITRGIGREFRCEPVSRSAQVPNIPRFLEGTYAGEAELSLGNVMTHVTQLDVDLCLRQGESPDRAGVRLLRKALQVETPRFPAVAVTGAIPFFVSFQPSETVDVGRSRKCMLRLDASDVSNEHARIGFENGQFWVEDLGSTNGTYVGGQRVTGRRVLDKDESIQIGAEFTLRVVAEEDSVSSIVPVYQAPPKTAEPAQSYPCVAARSDLVRPSRIALAPDMRISFGRDPGNDIWVGASHVSRQHGEIWCDADGAVRLIDQSSNGTFIAGERLPRETEMQIPETLTVVDLGGGVSLGICFDENDERVFLDSDTAGSSPASNALRDVLQERTPSSMPRVDETVLAHGSGDVLRQSALRDVLGGDAETIDNQLKSLGVFGASDSARGGGSHFNLAEEPNPRSNGSEEGRPTGFGAPQPNDFAVPQGPIGEPPVAGRFGRTILGIVVVLLIVTVLLGFVWFVGGDMFNNF